MLYIFSGLPGSGKSTLSKWLSARVGAVYLRIDTIEQALRDLCAFDVQGEGYRLAYRIARDNLRLGSSVVADSCNPIELTRREWEQVARDAGADYVNIEVVCSDPREHRRRAEQRAVEVAGLTQPTWSEIENREYRRVDGGSRRRRYRRPIGGGLRSDLLSNVSCSRQRFDEGANRVRSTTPR